jgi:hypothetical protein
VYLNLKSLGYHKKWNLKDGIIDNITYNNSKKIQLQVVNGAGRQCGSFRVFYLPIVRLLLNG